jgi:hypothetical protein
MQVSHTAVPILLNALRKLIPDTFRPLPIKQDPACDVQQSNRPTGDKDCAQNTH